MKSPHFFAATIATMTSLQGATIWSESFETDGDGSRYTLSSNFVDSANDYFARVDNGQIATLDGDYSNITDSFFFAAEDTDDNGGNGADEQSMTVTIDISNYENLSFSGDFGASGASDYDAADYIRVTYSVDGGTVQNLLWFESVQDGDAFNSPDFRQDTDFDGEGEAALANLSTTLSTYAAGIAQTGSSLELTIAVYMDAADEEIAFDNLTITGDLVPEPSVALLGALGLGVLLRRRR